MADLEKIKEKRGLKDLLEFSILNIDKPANYTSFQTAEIVGKILEARKFSHFGTLEQIREILKLQEFCLLL